MSTLTPIESGREDRLTGCGAAQSKLANAIARRVAALRTGIEGRAEEAAVNPYAAAPYMAGMGISGKRALPAAAAGIVLARALSPDVVDRALLQIRRLS
jgi:hypothetical protein